MIIDTMPVAEYNASKKQKQKRKHPESDLQGSCISWFDSQYPKYSIFLFSIPNGANLVKRKNKLGKTFTQINQLKKEGLRNGVADVFLSIPKLSKIPYEQPISYGMYIEFKAGKNTQSEEQIKFMLAVQAKGYDYKIIRSPDEFIKIVTEYLK